MLVAADENAPGNPSSDAFSHLKHDADFPRMPNRAQLLEMLREETFEQSLYRLKNGNLFFFPGVIDPIRTGRDVPPGGKPLEPELDFFVVSEIMGNRRVLKLHADLESLPPAMAAQHVNAQIGELLPRYRAAYAADKQINMTTGFLRKTLEENPMAGCHGVSYITNTPDPNEETLPGLRYGILSLVWLAGALNLHDSHDTIRAVVDEAVLQRDTLYNDEIHNRCYKTSILRVLSLYNRTVLSTALIRTASRPDLEEQYATRRATYSQVSFDEEALNDPAKLKIHIDYYNDMLDEDFEAVLAVLTNVQTL